MTTANFVTIADTGEYHFPAGMTRAQLKAAGLTDMQLVNAVFAP